MILEKVNSPQKECEDTAVRALGKICENMDPLDVSAEFRESMFNALVSKLSHGNDVIRSKAIRNLGKLIRYEFTNDIQTKEIMEKVKQVMGLDEDRQFAGERGRSCGGQISQGHASDGPARLWLEFRGNPR